MQLGERGAVVDLGHANNDRRVYSSLRRAPGRGRGPPKEAVALIKRIPTHPRTPPNRCRGQAGCAIVGFRRRPRVCSTLLQVLLSRCRFQRRRGRTARAHRADCSASPRVAWILRRSIFICGKLRARALGGIGKLRAARCCKTKTQTFESIDIGIGVTIFRARASNIQ